MSENRDVRVEELERLESGLFQLSSVINRHQEVVQKRFKVSNIEIDILRLLQTDGDQKMKDIGAAVKVKLSNLTNIIDRLESQKLVKRVNSKSDRRSIFVHVTAKGKKLLDDYAELLRELSSRMRLVMEKEQFGAFLEGLERISQVEVQPTA